MALSGTRLSITLKADILIQLQANFPINPLLLPAEKAALATGQQKIADSIGTPTGADVVSEVVTNEVNIPGTFHVDPSTIIAPSGGGPCTGTTPVLGTGSAT